MSGETRRMYHGRHVGVDESKCATSNCHKERVPLSSYCKTCDEAPEDALEYVPEGKKDDAGKPRWSLLTPEMEEWARIYANVGVLTTHFYGTEPNLAGWWAALTTRWGDPNDFLAGVVRVMTHGAAKYGDHNWKHVEYERYYDAYRRHLDAGWFAMGNNYDEDSGEHHLLHAGACVLIMYALKLEARNESVSG